VSGHRKLVSGKYLNATAALTLACLCGVRLASADVAGELTRAGELARAAVVQSGSRAAPASRPRPMPHPDMARRPLSLDLPSHAAFGRGSTEPQSVADAAEPERFGVSFPIRWQTEPELLRQARNFRHQGLPLVHLWKSDSGEHMLSIGLNGHGVPGIWLTQKVPD
jgi:hypothetical protein